VWLAAFCGVLVLPAAALLTPAVSVPIAFWEAPAPAADVHALAHERDAIAADLALSAARVSEADRLAAHTTVTGLAEAHAALAEREAVLAAATDRLHSAIAHGAATPPPAAAPVVVASEAWPWSTRIFMLWVAGFVMVGVAFAVGVLRTHLVACAALPASESLAEEVEILSAEMGIARDVRVVTWPGPAMPMTWGARQPVVLLPQDAAHWPADRLREVLTHELAHVRRGDWLARLLAAFVCALHWFNPLVWMAARKLRDEQELACDDAVLESGVRPSDYAAHLLDVARSLRTPRGVGHAAVAMARPSQLSNRLLAVLDDSRSRRAMPRGLVVATLLAFFVAIPLGAIVPGAPRQTPLPSALADVTIVASAVPTPAAETPPPASAAASAVIAVPATAAPLAAGGGFAYAFATKDCPELNTRGAGRGRGSNSSSHSSSSSDDGSPNRVTISISRGNCKYEVRFVGNVTFSDDDREITNVPRDAWVRVIEENGGDETRFEAAWRSGQLERRFQVNGNSVPETDELRAWLGNTLRATLSGSGYNAVPRVMRAYRTSGLDSALRLAEAGSSDYSKRQMLMALIDSVRVPAGEAARIARQARTMSSDYEKAELLIAVARKVGLNAQVQEAMAASTAEMRSDYERRRVLSAALARDGLSGQAATDLLATAELMRSDYEKAELLIGYLGNSALDEDRRASFFRAVGSMRSDYERRRVLSSTVLNPGAPNVVNDLAAQAERFRSDYERAELLIQMARRFSGNADARARISRATEGMTSSHEKDRVFAVVGRTMRF
jgi:beta-lactamase regulating signal transducer with metallopeptidase domain